MTKKIFASIFISCIAVLLASTIVIIGVLYNFQGNELMNQLHNEVNTVSAGVEEGGIGYLERLQLDDDQRVTWINSDGTVRFDSDASADKMENHGDRQEVKDAFENGEGEAVRNSDTLSEKTMYCAKKLSDNTVIRVSTNQYTIWVLLMNIYQPFSVMFMIVLFLSYITASLAAKRIVQPINRITPENIDEVKTYEEIKPLADKIRTQNMVIEKQIKDLKRTQAEFNTMTESMSEGLVIVDKTGEVLFFNKCVPSLLGTDKIEPKIHIEEIDTNLPLIGCIKASMGGEHISEIVEFNDKCLSVMSSPVYVDEKLRGAVAIILDVTEKQKREVLRREFSANVSHELKTPLSAILASAEVISMADTPKETDLHFAKNIIKETNRLIALVNDIIKLSKLDSNTESLKTELVDLHEIAQNAIDSLSPIAESNNIKLSLIGEESIARGVASLYDEVIYNLVDNAIKYNKPNGSVVVITAPVDKKIRLIVEDTGIGISKDDQERIFERFYRVDKSHSREVGGTGLGLSIVKHGIEQNNGVLKIESEIDKGTKITVDFPQI